MSNLLTAIKKYLSDNDIEGLSNDSCGCGVNDLAPCGNLNIYECKPAKLIKNAECSKCNRQCSNAGCDEIIPECWKEI